MLQRAASNAYSWWWASHIRTTQSKWLDANLQEMENRVKVMLKLLGEEADSFGKRAEMYYRRRPEVISHVEEVYRAYRALVERYDHISKELHKANHTIATACPEEVQYAMLEEEDGNYPKAIMPIDSRKIHKSTVEEILKRKREGQSERNKGGYERFTSHMSKEKAGEEISKLQKTILVLQTEKEFVKSSYESGIAKYWEIEKQITDMQEEICHIQDAFDADVAIEDVEARALMTVTALRSCQGTVTRLAEQFEKLIRIATMESEKIKSLREKLNIIKGNTNPPSIEVDITNMAMNDRVYSIAQGIHDLQPIYEKIENFFENNSESSVVEIAEKVNELVDKIMNLELKFPKQCAQIKQLKEENEELEKKLDDIQDEIALRDDQSDLNEQLKLVQGELNRVEILERSILEEEVLVSATFAEVFSCITNFSKAFEFLGPEDLIGLPSADGNAGTVPEHDNKGDFMRESSLLQGEEFKDREAPITGDQSHLSLSENSNDLSRDGCSKQDLSQEIAQNSSGGTDGIQDCKNNGKENFLIDDFLMQEKFRDERSLQACNQIGVIVSSEDKNGFSKTDKCSTNGSLEEVALSLSGGINKIWDMGTDGSGNFAQEEIFRDEYPPTAGDQIHLHSEIINTSNKKDGSSEKESSVEDAECSLGGASKIQDLENDSDENFVNRSSLIQEEELRDGKSSKTCSANMHNLSDGDHSEENPSAEAVHSCSSSAENILDSHHEESPKPSGQLIIPENIISLNKCCIDVSSTEEAHTSLGHMDNIQDLKNIVLVDAYSSQANGQTSLHVPSEGSQETEVVHQQVSEILGSSENMGDYISHCQLEKKNSKGAELAREASTFSNRRSRSIRGEKFTSVGQEDAPSWQEFLLNGLEGREAILLADYTSVLRNYKETKRRLAELEKKNQEHLEETKVVIRELRNANSMKYVEIQSLRDLLDSSEIPSSNVNTKAAHSSSTRSDKEVDISDQNLDRETSTVEETNLSHTDVPQNASPFEDKFRSEIDTLVEENLQFLVRYGISCHHMQGFDSKYQELQNEMEKLEDEKAEEPGGTIQPKPTEKKLRELRSELDVWFEQNALLNEELQLKITFLCRMQEEIAEALRASSDIDAASFTSYEAAKFQGEVLNMQ